MSAGGLKRHRCDRENSGGSPLFAKVTGAAGARCAAVFKGARQHVPRSVVGELEAEIKRVDADCLISFGGGSPIDTCKVASHAFLVSRDASRELIHIAIPTTLSAGEYTHAGGVTDESTLVKSGVSDPRLQPRTVINDPLLTMETPSWLWVATGMARSITRSSRFTHTASSAERRAGREGDRAARCAPADVNQIRSGPDRAPRMLSDGGVVLDFWRDEHALRAFAFARASDWTALERAARRHFVHHAPACDALHGGDRGRAVWSDRRRSGRAFRFRESESWCARVRGPRGKVYCGA